MTDMPSRDELLAKVRHMQERAGVCPTCDNRRLIPDPNTGYLRDPCPDCENQP